MKYYIFSFCLSILILQPAIGQFQECNSPTTKDLHDVNFINENIGVAVGDSGTIIRTIDGGLNWAIVMVNDSVSFKKIKFFNSLNGIAIGSDIYITEDGGMSWTTSGNSNYEFYDVEIINGTTCIVSGMPNRIIKSTNYGNDWEILVSDTSDYEIRCLSFLNEEVGYASHGYGFFNSTLKTEDGGETWIEIEDESGEHLTIIEDINFISEDVGFRGGWYGPHLMRTQNSSEYWEDVNLPDSTINPDFGIYDFHIKQSLSNVFYACGWYGDIFKSTDGGNNWIELNSGVANIILYGIYFVDDNNGCVVGQYGTIFKTENGGEIVGLNNISDNLNIFIFPNPAKDLINIENPNKNKIHQIQIFNNNGQLLKLIVQPENKIDISDLPIGVCFIKLVTDKGIYSQKLIKE